MDAVLEKTGTRERKLRLLPSRVVVYDLTPQTANSGRVLSGPLRRPGFVELRGLAFSGQASGGWFHATACNFWYSAWTSRGGR
ncbi:transposase domain-containing protein [Streptomyces sp. NBC_01619]|uniref:hypothetical protein n=1 Tax=Streptomyces sp. NBC_01619 TaxID=2975901 RepID=UPI0022538FEC|nr:hypothetical protein [Streptomyces sp. NBC_01619]MCX4515699.1 transposase domain-containing protein [Streptomyces sp. NBC_01619]